MDFSNYKIRCSSIGKIMTNMPGKKDTNTLEEMSETCKSHLVECYVREKYGRDKEIISKYLEKGLQVEEDGITLYSRITKNFFRKNENRIENDYLTGHPDLFLGDSITEATTIIDIKSSWDIFTFFETMTKKANQAYLLQLQGYMALTGATDSRLVYCLISTPNALIEDEQKKLQWKMGVIDPENNPVFKEACDYLYTSMMYEDIDIMNRYNEFFIFRDDALIESVYERVRLCREFLSKFDERNLKS